MSRVEARVFEDKLAALRYNREQAGQFFSATVPGKELVTALEAVCNAISECETVGSVHNYGSRAGALDAAASDIIARCRKSLDGLTDTGRVVYVVAVSLHAAQLALVDYLMEVTKWTKKKQDELYIAALEAETSKSGDKEQP